MKYFITGATGFVGSWVAQQLADKGAEITCLARKTSNLKWLKDLPLDYCYGSLSEPETLKDGIRNADYVLHIAGVTKALSLKDFYRGNVEATRNILEVVKAVNPGIKKFVSTRSPAAPRWSILRARPERLTWARCIKSSTAITWCDGMTNQESRP